MSKRRFIASSSEYEPPMSSDFEHDLEASLRLLSLLENPSTSPPTHEPLQPQKTQIELARMLSAKSIISTTSSFAAEQAKANEEASRTRTFRKIGAGACGAVFAADGESLSYKIGKTGISDDDAALWTDFYMHGCIMTALRKFKADTEIPNVHIYIDHDNKEWWEKHQELEKAASSVCNLPARVLVTERILPLPAPIREKLIDQFCKENLRASALADTANKDCLVRIYLGSMKGRATSFFSLRNFKLHLNQMIDIGLDFEMLAVSIGQTLAIIHWEAKADARDVEFVLGSSATVIDGKQTQDIQEDDSIGKINKPAENFVRRETRLFVLDFNQVRRITMDDDGVACAVEAFFLNDPYYPRPCERSKVQEELWNSFVRSYLDTADIILRDQKENRVLPRRFISGVIEHIVGKKRMVLAAE
ncbi:hypothetical protein AYL99_08984 [Fonsecaea erecta]|uniref:DUF3669 domain-containing protein n=1 Tax=Fonsecaea erecta TaxID=1367422 RepID=A0A178ZB46_9EURO|nr:hypothetical protein AYL99_08984 [Fonsecaea erecta]OAP56872.1 hypothetical protein AYL99_08984 [Fonsecaea erecta]